MGTNLATRVNSVATLLERGKQQIAAALPKHITPERMIRVVLTSLRQNPKLLECTQESLMSAIIESAQLGLEPDGVLGHAYLVPYGKTAQLLPGYKGLIDLCRRSGNISTIDAQCVYDGDAFDFGLGDHPFISHKPDLDGDRSDDNIRYVYAVAKLRDGGVQRHVMSRKQIDEHCRRYSRATSKDTPWLTAFPWMAKKTALRQLVKLLPVSVETQRLVGRDELVEAEALPTAATTIVSSLDDLAEHLESAPPTAAAQELESQAAELFSGGEPEDRSAAYEGRITDCGSQMGLDAIAAEAAKDDRLDAGQKAAIKKACQMRAKQLKAETA